MPTDTEDAVDTANLGPLPPVQPRPVDTANLGPLPPIQAPQRFQPPPAPPVRSGGGTAPHLSAGAYQDQLESEQLAIYRQAKNVAQAEKDVASARRMLGILNADRDVASGVPVDKAIYRNLPFLVSPSERGAMANYRNLRPVPPPYQQNFQVGTNQVPAVITPGPGGAQRTQFIPQSAIPKPEFKASIEEIAPGIKAAKLGPNHYQLLERPNIKGTPTQLEKVQHEIWRGDLKSLERKLEFADPKAQPAIQAQIDETKKKMLDAAATAKGGKGDRVRVDKMVGGKLQKMTVPRSQLSQAVNEGWEEIKSETKE